jgi:dCTP deaminase
VEAAELNDRTSAGIFSARMISELVERGAIAAASPVSDAQIQPASLDLRLGPVAYRVRASFLTGPALTVKDRIEDLKLHQIDISDGAVLERGCVYIVPLAERLGLPVAISAAANPKSSTGRLDVFTRLITDHGRAFDTIAPGYEGPLYLEVSPRTFPVLVREGSKLAQIRFRATSATLTAAEHLELHLDQTLVFDKSVEVGAGVPLSIDLEGAGRNKLVGFRAKRHTAVIDVDAKGALDVVDFWDPIIDAGQNRLILDPDEFYILVSGEAVHVPPDFAAEMEPFDPLVGEFRVHYAGFFDPGFGHAGAGGQGSRAVLEVRSHEVPFLVEHGQRVGRLIYERMAERPATLYGTSIASNYQAQALKLSKHFRTFSVPA